MIIMIEKTLLGKLFGKVEIKIVLKKIQGKTLKQTERNYLSKSIRPKLRAINYIARLHLLEKINQRKERITKQEIIYNLSRYGYDLIALTKIKNKKKIPLEKLIITILIDYPKSRFIEAIPILLLKNKINQFKLLELAAQHNVKNEIGYLTETALLIKKKKELIGFLEYLKKSKEKEKKILGEDLGEEYREFLLKHSPKRIKSWNLLGRYFDRDFKMLMKAYL